MGALGVCWHTMKRTTIKIPDELDARLRNEAARRNITVSELVREALQKHLGPNRASLKRLVGILDGGMAPDDNRSIRELIDQGWGLSPEDRERNRSR